MRRLFSQQLINDVNSYSLKLTYGGRSSVDASWHGKDHSPDFSKLFYIESGMAYITTANNERFTFEPGNWYFIPSGLSYSYECPNEMLHFYFHIKLCGDDGIDLLRSCGGPLKASADEKEDLSDISSPNAQINLRRIIYKALYKIIEDNHITIQQHHFSPCIEKALLYICTHLSSKLTVTEIAEAIFVSKSTLTKHFKQEMSVSVKTFIQNRVMHEAVCELLLGTSSILQISEKYGFSDQPYFSRCFKEYFGISPREYRKRKIY